MILQCFGKFLSVNLLITSNVLYLTVLEMQAIDLNFRVVDMFTETQCSRHILHGRNNYDKK